MGDELGGNEAKTTGSGQSVSVVISHGAGFWLAVSIVAVVLLLAFTAHASIKAENKAEAAVKSSDESASEFRMTQFWLQRASLACQNNDHMPAIPASLLK